MLPVLFRIDGFEIRSYGVMLAISFILGTFMSMRRAKAQNIDPHFILDLVAVIVISSIFGARLLYYVQHTDEFENIIQAFSIFHNLSLIHI